MDFILIGEDPTATAFVRSAQARGHRLVAYWEMNPASSTFSEQLGAVPIRSIDQIAQFGAVDFLVLSGEVRGRADRIRQVIRSIPIDLAISVPLDEKPDVYYELGLWQKETGSHVTPLLSEWFHPALERMREACPPPVVGDAIAGGDASVPVGIEAALPLIDAPGCRRYAEGWNWLRALGGEIEGISTIASAEDPLAADEIVASVRFSNRRLANVRFLRGEGNSARFRVRRGDDEWTCDLPEGFDGPAIFTATVDGTALREEFPPFSIADQWVRSMESKSADPELVTAAVRQIELASATYRSLKYQRAMSLEYDEFSEEASFKGIMAASGCGLLWAIVLTAILSAMGVPFIHYLILPALLVFLGLQLLGFVFRRPEATTE